MNIYQGKCCFFSASVRCPPLVLATDSIGWSTPSILHYFSYFVSLRALVWRLLYRLASKCLTQVGVHLTFLFGAKSCGYGCVQFSVRANIFESLFACRRSRSSRMEKGEAKVRMQKYRSFAAAGISSECVNPFDTVYIFIKMSSWMSDSSVDNNPSAIEGYFITTWNLTIQSSDYF